MDKQVSNVKASFVLSPLEFLSDECRQELFIKWNLMDGPCVLALFSKVLGYLLISMVAVVQLPQITKILRHRHGQGISQASVLLMLQASSVKVAYCMLRRFPISVWGESIMLMGQYLMMSCLLLLYHRGHRGLLLFLCLYIPAMLALLLPLLPDSAIVSLKAINLPVVTVSKILQIYTTHRLRDTGQLSSASVYMITFRSFGRLATSLIDTDDPLLILSYCQTCLWNTILSMQVTYYKKMKTIKKS